jgi:hypothetical protein
MTGIVAQGRARSWRVQAALIALDHQQVMRATAEEVVGVAVSGVSASVMSIRSSSGARALISLILPSTALWRSIVLRVGIDSLQDAADHATRAAPPDPTRVGLAPPLAGRGPTRRSRKHASPGQHGANADHQDRAQPMTHCACTLRVTVE